jgi:hypothetical protein
LKLRPKKKETREPKRRKKPLRKTRKAKVKALKKNKSSKPLVKSVQMSLSISLICSMKTIAINGAIEMKQIMFIKSSTKS